MASDFRGKLKRLYRQGDVPSVTRGDTHSRNIEFPLVSRPYPPAVPAPTDEERSFLRFPKISIRLAVFSRGNLTPPTKRNAEICVFFARYHCTSTSQCAHLSSVLSPAPSSVPLPPPRVKYTYTCQIYSPLAPFVPFSIHKGLSIRACTRKAGCIG
jgi:hypothetical protein